METNNGMVLDLFLQWGQCAIKGVNNVVAEHMVVQSRLFAYEQRNRFKK
jgi:hypothetical protein